LLDSDQSEELILEIEAAHFHRKLINGHAPASGLDLSTYIATGINDDHTCISVENGIEKIRSGMWLMIKEGSLDKNLETLHPLMKSYPTRCNLCTDDILPNELIELGHMDHLVRKAIGLGVSPTTAIASATYNIAQRYHLEEYIGSITPGKVADILVLEDLNKFAIEQVFVEGREIVEEGKFLIRPGEWDLPDWATNSVRLPALAPSSFLIPSDTDSVVRVIELLPGIGARNKASTWKARSSQGYLCAGDNVNHLSVINRYGNNRVANGFCRGFSIRGGAIASTIAHDHHNLVIVGDNEESMYRAALSISEMNGGLVVVKGRDVIACLPLPIGGLMSDLPSKELVNRLNACTKAAWKLGCSLENPFISLSFIGLTTMPDYGFTDIGLIDANRNEIISVFLSPTR
jgi:adenine deaminase